MILTYTKRAITALTLIVLMGVSAYAVINKLQGNNMLSVQSKSMVPMLRKGDLVGVKRVPANSLKVGDVITFINPDNNKETITHRIVQTPSWLNGQTFTTKGDANQSVDKPISSVAIVGKYTHRVPFAGYAADFVRKPLGLILIIYIPALMIMIGEIRRLAAYYKAQQLYILPGRLSRLTHPSKAMGAIKLLPLILLVPLALTIKTQAAMHSTATLTGTTITGFIPEQQGHPLIRLVTFECSQDNTTDVSRLMAIMIYSPLTTDVPSGNWTIKTQAGTLVTFPAKTVFDSKEDFDIEPDVPLSSGINYAGDFIGLYDANGALVDGISWGSDTSQLTPPLPGATVGTEFRRLNTETDTDTANDWAVELVGCQPE